MTDLNGYFVERKACPCCLNARCRALYECDFCADPIRQYLKDFYDPQGGVDFECLKGARYVLRQCSGCELIYQQYVGNDILLGKLYEEWILPSKAKERDAQSVDLNQHIAYAREIIAVLSQIGKKLPDARLLDFGMGWGRWCRIARSFGAQVFGSELSGERVSHARTQGIEIVSPKEIPMEAFDFINTEQVFEHIPYPAATLELLAQALKPGGFLKISVPDGVRIPELLARPDWGAPKGSARSLNAVAPLEHINCYTRKALVLLGRKVGMAPLELDWDTRVDVVCRNAPAARRSRWRRIRARLGKVKSALRELVFPAGATSNTGTYLFFRKL